MMYGLTPFARNAFSILNAFDDFDKDFFSGTMPMNTCRTDIRDAGDKYIMESELPGFEKEDIKIDINGDYLVISAEKKAEKEDGSASAFNFFDFVFRPTASAAPPCAATEHVTIALYGLFPNLSSN